MLHSKISKICEQKFDYLNYSNQTKQVYMYYINQFLSNYKTDISKVNSIEFQKYLDNYKFTSVSQQNQVINAIRFLYKYGLNKKYDKVSFERPRKEYRLPEPLSQEEVELMFNNCQNIKHKAIMSLLFMCGLRVSEVINLKPENIDRLNMVIHIKQSKGNKDRNVPMNANLLSLLERYYREYKPKEYMFNGQFTNQYSQSSINQFLKQIALKAKIKKNMHAHIGRHSCFTQILSNGIDMSIIQKIAGHNNIKTTQIYAKITNLLISNTIPYSMAL